MHRRSVIALLLLNRSLPAAAATTATPAATTASQVVRILLLKNEPGTPVLGGAVAQQFGRRVEDAPARVTFVAPAAAPGTSPGGLGGTMAVQASEVQLAAEMLLPALPARYDLSLMWQPGTGDAVPPQHLPLYIPPDKRGDQPLSVPAIKAVGNSEYALSRVEQEALVYGDAAYRWWFAGRTAYNTVPPGSRLQTWGTHALRVWFQGAYEIAVNADIVGAEEALIDTLAIHANEALNNPDYRPIFVRKLMGPVGYLVPQYLGLASASDFTAELAPAVRAFLTS